MGACFRVCHGYIADTVDREAVVKATVITQNTAVAVGGVLAKTDIGNDEERREASAEETDGLHHWALGVVGCSTEGVFNIWRDRDTKKDYRTEAFPYKRVEVGNELVDAAAVLIGEGGNEGLFFGLVRYKEGVDEHGLRTLAECSTKAKRL